ncbi:MAG: response regulator [Actinomycetia bacterium]|nr:response regulator [Actinomycetes bacterium]
MKRKEYYTTSEVAKILHVAVGSVINWVDDGQFRAIITPGGHRKIPRKELIRFLKDHRYDIPKNLIQNKSVYLVDDEEDVHSFFNEIFKNMDGFDVKSYFSGIEALIAVGQQSPEIMIVDMLMPDIDGAQVIKNIKTNEKLNDVHVIAISADADKKEESIKAGANIFLKKPFDVDEFKNAVQNA